MSDEFKKARDEEAPEIVHYIDDLKAGTSEYERHMWIDGADWAYAWCQKDFRKQSETFREMLNTGQGQLEAIQKEADALAAVLEEYRTSAIDFDEYNNEDVISILDRYKTFKETQDE